MGTEITDPALLSQLNGTPAIAPKEITDPNLLAQLNGSPVTAANRVQAGEAGILKGASYLAGLVPDTIANAYNLGQSMVGGGYTAITGKPAPRWLVGEVGDVSPVGGWISRQLDKSPITTTQLARPDDPASRYLAAATSVIPAVAAGGNGVANTANMAVRAAIPAVVGQAVAEKKPFDADWKNNAAATLAQVLTGSITARRPGADREGREVSNQTVRDAQAEGYVFPPATTNPSSGNKLRETIAGKMDVQQHAALHNVEQTTAAARDSLGLPPGRSIDPSEIQRIYRDTSAPYQGIRSAGAISTLNPAFAQEMQDATRTLSGAANVSPALGEDNLPRVVQDILSRPSHDAGDLLDTSTRLRDQASAAFRAGDNGRGAAYRGVSRAIENQIERSAQSTQPDLVANFQAARTRRAIAHTVEDAMNEGSGQVDPRKLVNADILPPQLQAAARAAELAPKAFTPQTSSPGTHHLGFWGSAIAAGAAGEHMFPGHGWEAAAIPFAVNAGRAGTRMYALSPIGQRGAIATRRGPIDIRQQLVTALSAQERANAQ